MYPHSLISKAISPPPSPALPVRFGDGYILLGFSSGYFVALSSHMKEIGTELFQTKNHRTVLTDIAVNLALSKAASCGDNVSVRGEGDCWEGKGQGKRGEGRKKGVTDWMSVW